MFLESEEYYSTLLCFVEQGQGGLSDIEKIVEKDIDALYLQTQKYDPNMVNTLLLSGTNYARSQGMRLCCSR